MIITRSPLRITLGGGGTDLPSYYEKREGFLISAAVDKYVYILINKTFDNSLLIKYSQLERVKNVAQIKHPIVREALKVTELECAPLEICSMADVPAGTGMGSSGTFTTALLKALHGYKGEHIGTRSLAEEACEIEMNRLKEPTGKQDQYVSAYGGIICMNIDKNGYVQAEPLKITDEVLYNLEDNLVLFFTGYSHSAGDILSEQNSKSKEDNEEMLKNLDYVKQLGLDSRAMLEQGRLEDFAEIMNVHWEFKKKRSGAMSNSDIDEWYDFALKNGALGGKLIGAGGGGFLMFYANDKVKLRRAFAKIGLEEIRFRFEMEGTKMI
ncbi:GHMP kinase [Enterocloster bolteae]|uniref:GHMP family kinase ATP-binding protein n=1 Tax=Enterocloster bolteae TaxID=208479 RepID=UPI002A80AF72|nr:GHMP kinase [Enterocloster bolteae]